MRHLAYAIFLSAGLLLQPLASSANCGREFKVGTSAGIIVKQNEGVNDLADMLWSEIKKRTDCTFSERPLSLTKALDEINNHRIDIVAFAFKDSKWEQSADFQSIYSVDRILLIAKKFYKPQLSVSDYLKNSEIVFGTTSGGMLYMKNEELTQLDKAKRVKFDPFPDGVLQLLAQNKVQAAFVTPAVYRRYLKPFNLGKVVEPVGDPENSLSLSLYFSKKRVSAKEQAIFLTAIKQIQQDGTLRKILLRFVTEEDLKKYYHFGGN